MVVSFFFTGDVTVLHFKNSQSHSIRLWEKRGRSEGKVSKQQRIAAGRQTSSSAPGMPRELEFSPIQFSQLVWYACMRTTDSLNLNYRLIVFLKSLKSLDKKAARWSYATSRIDPWFWACRHGSPWSCWICSQLRCDGQSSRPREFLNPFFTHISLCIISIFHSIFHWSQRFWYWDSAFCCFQVLLISYFLLKTDWFLLS